MARVLVAARPSGVACCRSSTCSGRLTSPPLLPLARVVALPPTPAQRACTPSNPAPQGMDVSLICDGSGAGRGGGEKKDVLPPLMPGMKPRQQA